MKIIKFLLLVLSLCTNLSLCAQRKGDVNVDGFVDISDVVATINIIAGSKFHKPLADINSDKIVDISDVVSLINIIAGKSKDKYKFNDNNDPAVLAGLCPDSHHPHAIDLGFESKWACCNIDASAPWEYGGHYAFGETEKKDKYIKDNYLFFDYNAYMKGKKEYNCYNTPGSSEAVFDWSVARVKWSNNLNVYNNWSIPRKDQITRLLDNCESEWITINNIKGRKFTSYNGNSIFFPAAGSFIYGKLDEGIKGRYWSATKTIGTMEAYILYFDSTRPECNEQIVSSGMTVRPIQLRDPSWD